MTDIISACDFAINKPKMRLPFRHVQTVLLLLGTALAHSMRVDLSIALVAMMGDNQNNSSDTKPLNIRGKAVVLSAFMAGHMLTQLPGPQLAAWLGPKLLVAVGVGGSAAAAALIPLGAYHKMYSLVIACRVMQGLAQGAITPSINILIANWMPMDEKLKVKTFISTGMQFGVASQFLISGFIIKYWKWSTVFYINAVAGAVWTILYVIVGSSSPQTSRFINDEEKKYIDNALEQVNQNNKLPLAPWHALWRSTPVLALVLASCAHCWGLWTVMTLIPLYLNDVHNADFDQIGVVSALPFIAMLIMKFPYRCLSNCIINKTCISVTVSRKIFNTIGSYGPGSVLLWLSFVTMDLTTTAVALIVMFALKEAQSCGFMLGHADIAPNFSEQLCRVTSNFGGVLSVLAPLTAGAMILNEHDQYEWQQVFKLSASFYIASNIIYFVFGTSEKQAWNDPKSKDLNEEQK